MNKISKLTLRNCSTAILLSFGLISPTYSFDDNQAVSIGPLQLSMAYCEQVDKVSSMVNAFSNVQWPVTGVPGVTMGVLQRSSVVLDFCDYLSRMKNLSLQDKIWATAEAGNKLMGNKFDDQLSITRSTWDLKDIVIDGSGKKRPLAEILTESNSQRMNSWLKEAADYNDKYINPDDPINLRNRSQMEGDLNRLNQIAYQKSLNNEVMNCPNTNPADEKLAGIYEKEITPEIEFMDKTKNYIDFYSESLRQMGIKISRNEKDYNEYLKMLSDLQIRGQRYEINVRTKTVETTKRRKKASASTSNDPMANKTEDYKEKIKQNYQSFSVIPNRDTVDNFSNAYMKKWDTWTLGQIAQNSYGLLDSETRRANYEDQFKDWNILCNRGEILAKLDSEDPKYEQKLDEEMQACKDRVNGDISQANGLLKFYAEELFKETKKYKEAQAHVWTFESYYLGNFRSIDGKATDKNGFAQEQVTCGKLDNIAALQEVMLKQEGVNAELNQMLVEQAFKTNKILQDQEAQRMKELEEQEKKNLIDAEIKRRQSQDYFKYLNQPEQYRGL